MKTQNNIKILCLMISICLIGCGGKTNDNAVENTAPKKQKELDGKVEERISLIGETYESKSDDGVITVKIAYPKVEGMKDKEMQKLVNEKIKKILDFESTIPKASDFEGLPQEMRGYNKQGSFTRGIINSNIISFSTGTTEHMAGSAHPSSIVKGYNINPNTGELYTIEDFIIPTKMEDFNNLLHTEMTSQNCAEEIEGMFEDELCNFDDKKHSFDFTEKGITLHLTGCFSQPSNICNHVSLPFAKLSTLMVKKNPISDYLK